MEALPPRSSRGMPEKLVSQLAVRLRHHALWDSLLLIFPPLLLIIDLVFLFYRAAWFTETIPLTVVPVAAAMGGLAALIRYRPLVPSVQSTARLIDQSAQAKDRFLTLVTIEPTGQNASLVSRLSLEAAGFRDHIKPKRDFPYRIKHSFYWSLTVSSIIALLFHLLLPIAPLMSHPLSGRERLGELADTMAQRPGLGEVARTLRTLALKLDDPRLSELEKQRLIEETQKNIDTKQKQEEQKGDSELLSQASGTLKDLQPQSGSGQNQKNEKAQGGGDIQSNLPQDKPGKNQPNQGSGGDHKGERNAKINKDMQQGKGAEGDPKDQRSEKSPQKKESGKGNEPQKNESDRDRSHESMAKTQGGKDEKAGRSKPSEEIPQGSPPAERLYQPGERGKQGIKGARYVTVQLPEETAMDSKGEKTGALEAQGRKGGVKIPMSNAPLPAHTPDAPTEKQRMPLEYRGVLR